MNSHKNTNRRLGIYLSSTSSAAIDHMTDFYQKVYRGLFFELLNLDCTPIIVYDEANNYLGKGRFKRYWEVSEDYGEINFVHREEEIQLPFIMDKSRFSAKDIPTTTPAEVRDICRDKYLSYLFAPEWHASSFLIRNEEDLKALTGARAGQKMALKELDSSGGVRVFVGEIEKYGWDLKYPLIAQDFIETAGGIRGICEGRHDLRVIMYDGEPISLLLRTPPEDGLVANLSFGGSYAGLDLSRIPRELREILRAIDERFPADKTRFYSVDFGCSAEGWKIFELNAWPGLKYASYYDKDYMRRLTKHLVQSVDAAVANS